MRSVVLEIDVRRQAAALLDRPAELSPPPEPPKLLVAADVDQAASDAAAHMTEVTGGTWNALLLVPGANYGLAIPGGEGAEELIEGVVAGLKERR